MLFNIDSDDGHSITGWIAPDNPSVVPHVVCVMPDREDTIIKANVFRPDVRDLGVHTTGQVGFRIDESDIPELATLRDIQLVAGDTDIPIYRRLRVGVHVERKLFIFDASAMPQRRILENISRCFALVYTSCERHPLETMIVLINNHFTNSIAFAGRPNYNRYSSFLESNEYVRAAILRDPFEELAERLLFLSMIGKSNGTHLLPIYAAGLMPLVEFARDLPFNDPKGLLSAFRRLSNEARYVIESPMVRMLGCGLEDIPKYHHVSLALDHLASMDAVGTRARYSDFRVMLAHAVGTDILGSDDHPASFQTVQSLAQNLSRIGMVEDLLEYDIALYSLADKAISAALNGSETLIGRDNQTV